MRIVNGKVVVLGLDESEEEHQQRKIRRSQGQQACIEAFGGAVLETLLEKVLW